MERPGASNTRHDTGRAQRTAGPLALPDLIVSFYGEITEIQSKRERDLLWQLSSFGSLKRLPASLVTSWFPDFIFICIISLSSMMTLY